MCAMKLADTDNEDDGTKNFHLGPPQKKVRVWLTGVNDGDDVKAHLKDKHGIHVWDPPDVGPVKVHSKTVGSVKRQYATFKSTPSKVGKELEAHKNKRDIGDLTIEVTNQTSMQNDQDSFQVNYLV